MRLSGSRFTHIAVCALFLAGCSTGGNAPVPAGFAGTGMAPSTAHPPVPNVSGTYIGTVTEASQGRSIKDPLEIVIRQKGTKFTGIFDIMLHTMSDPFPIKKGVVSVSHGITVLHFVIESAPGRNARATATLAGGKIKGKAKVSAHHGPAVLFKYSAKKV